jgi:hypothetical protein
MIVGMIGYAGSGKDTAAEALISQGFERRAFADTIKTIARDIGWDGIKDDYGRRLLQNLGASCRHHIDESVWVEAALRGSDDRDIVITDVRYVNEAEFIAAAGGVLVRIERPGVGPANDHISESELESWSVDIILFNGGSPADLHSSLLTELNLRRGVGARPLSALP